MDLRQACVRIAISESFQIYNLKFGLKNTTTTYLIHVVYVVRL
jgi:hypothetical protein